MTFCCARKVILAVPALRWSLTFLFVCCRILPGVSVLSEIIALPFWSAVLRGWVLAVSVAIPSGSFSEPLRPEPNMHLVSCNNAKPCLSRQAPPSPAPDHDQRGTAIWELEHYCEVHACLWENEFAQNFGMPLHFADETCCSREVAGKTAPKGLQQECLRIVLNGKCKFKRTSMPKTQSCSCSQHGVFVCKATCSCCLSPALQFIRHLWSACSDAVLSDSRIVCMISMRGSWVW